MNNPQFGSVQPLSHDFIRKNSVSSVFEMCKSAARQFRTLSHKTDTQPHLHDASCIESDNIVTGVDVRRRYRAQARKLRRAYAKSPQC